jgi:hypothetical protein
MASMRFLRYLALPPQQAAYPPFRYGGVGIGQGVNDNLTVFIIKDNEIMSMNSFRDIVDKTPRLGLSATATYGLRLSVAFFFLDDRH